MGQMISRMLTPGLPDQADAVTPNIPTPIVSHCLCPMPSGAGAASSFFYSTRIAELSEQRSKFDNQVEFDVESSTSHWTTTVSAANFDESDEQVPNSEVFEKLKEHPEWGPFFRRHPYELEIGAKIAEGGQGEIFKALGTNKYDARCSKNKKIRLVLKVFKEGFPLDQLQRTWPPGIASAAVPHRYFGRQTRRTLFTFRQSSKQSSERNGIVQKKVVHVSKRVWTDRQEGYLCWALGAQLMDDRRLAFIFDRYEGDLRKLTDENMLKRNGCPPFDGHLTHVYIFGVAKGMCNLHKLGILHNDLKAANVLVADHDGYPAMAIADFESSVGIEGIGFWRAPVVLLALKERQLHQETFTQQSDVYSFAMTCYEVITGRMPFEGHDVWDYNIILRGERPTLPSGPYSMYNNLMMKCWHQDSLQRPSFAEVVEDLNAIDRSSWPKCHFERTLLLCSEGDTEANSKPGVTWGSPASSTLRTSKTTDTVQDSEHQTECHCCMFQFKVRSIKQDATSAGLLTVQD